MTVGNIVDLLDEDTSRPLIVQQKESANIEGQFVDGSGDPVLVGAITAFTSSSRKSR